MHRFASKIINRSKIMKQILVILFFAMLMFSCTSFEDEAKKQMKETMIELARNSETLKITNIKTKYVCDSLCILHFFGSGQNGLGGWNKSKFEYIYCYLVKDDGNKEYREILFNLDKEKSIFEPIELKFEKFWKSLKNGEEIEPDLIGYGVKAEMDEDFSDDKEEKYKARYIYMSVIFSGIFNGRVIDKE